MLRLPSVSLLSMLRIKANSLIAKFTGYMYGGRPLGLTFVKYTNANGNEMEGQEATGGMTQDQMM